MEGEDKRRRFRLSDGLILIAGAAVGMGLSRVYLPEMFHTKIRYTLYSFPVREVLRAICWGLALLPIPAALSIAVFVIRLLPPRPPRRRLAAQPGVATGLAATLGVALVAVANVGAVAIHATQGPESPGVMIPYQTIEAMTRALPSLSIGPMIACVWVHLWLGRRWRPEPSWIDRAGRAMGVCWIAWTFAEIWLLTLELS